MMKHTETYEQYDVVVVPFPFVDSIQVKKRPVLVISSSEKFQVALGLSVFAMITSAEHDRRGLDTEINNLKACGLSHPSIIRMKLFTLDNEIIIRKLGKLDNKDKEFFVKNLKNLFKI